jgi:hypothetical protein
MRCAALLLIAAVLVGGCSEGESSTPRESDSVETEPASTRPLDDSTSQDSPSPARPRQHTDRTAATARRGSQPTLPAGYAGIGATRDAFVEKYPHLSNPPLGTFSYSAEATVRGRVTGYTMIVNVRPKMGALDLSSMLELPPDADPLNDGPACRLWRSSLLGRTVGMPFIRAQANRQLQSATVYLEPTRPSCAG